MVWFNKNMTKIPRICRPLIQICIVAFHCGQKYEKETFSNCKNLKNSFKFNVGAVLSLIYLTEDDILNSLIKSRVY